MAGDTSRYDEPKIEEAWVMEQRARIPEYLEHEELAHGEIGEWPAWHLAPFASIWAIERAENPGWVGFWVIVGDGPTDFVSADNRRHPRLAMQAFGEQWQSVADHLDRGETHPEITIGVPSDWPHLVEVLRPRAAILLKTAADDNYWEEWERVWEEDD
ncbi:MAG: DUF4826 family protein [Chthonomonas sp.]|nr:DUF4826 family protein [Chthonomonas sp.]